MTRRFLVGLALFASSALAQRPITFEDLAAIHRIGAPRVSPDGKWIAYDSSTPDLAANSSRSAVFLMPSTGGTAGALFFTYSRSQIRFVQIQ